MILISEERSTDILSDVLATVLELMGNQCGGGDVDNEGQMRPG